MFHITVGHNNNIYDMKYHRKIMTSRSLKSLGSSENLEAEEIQEI